MMMMMMTTAIMIIQRLAAGRIEKLHDRNYGKIAIVVRDSLFV